MDNFIASYVSLVNGIKLSTLVVLIGIDTILGVVDAIVEKKFDWHKIASFVDTSVFTLGGGYLLVGVFATVQSGFSYAVPATWAIINAKLIADIVTKLKKLGVAIKGK